MGRPGVPAYYEHLGDAVEDAKKLIAKIETNKYTKNNVLHLVNANAAIIEFILDDKVNSVKG